MSSTKKTKAKDAVMLDIGVTCALTEDAPKPEELVEPQDDDDAAKDYELIPVGWVQITVTRRFPNPEYIECVEAFEESVAAAMAQAMAQAQAQNVTPTDEEKNDTLKLIRRVTQANYHGMMRDTPKMIVVSEDVWVSPPDRNAQVKAELERLGKGLSIDFGAVGEA